ncbi:hypothetical protein ElyMa_005141900 [Elysia marginata]|uniref:Uncharacterized protein n=1 Tax=Elysia marginata TaxID=1093978 RepID=A0AAV4JS95_9GAST|nr:hypothetical protein ElyMa_005141900 [Elysia marginata]
MAKWKDVETPDGSRERQREIAEVGGWALFVSNNDSRYCVQRLLACLCPLAWPKLVAERGRASEAGQKTVTGADWCSSLMVSSPPRQISANTVFMCTHQRIPSLHLHLG